MRRRHLQDRADDLAVTLVFLCELCCRSVGRAWRENGTMQQNKRALNDALVPYIPSVARKVQRSERRRCAVAQTCCRTLLCTVVLHCCAGSPGQCAEQRTDPRLNNCRMEPPSSAVFRIIDSQVLKVRTASANDRRERSPIQLCP